MGRFGDDGVPIAGGGPRQPQGQFVGLAGRVQEEAGVQGRRHGGEKSLGILVEMVAEIAGVGVEGAQLFTGRFDHIRMAVSHVGHVVVCIEVASPRVVKEVLHLSPDNLEGIGVSQGQVATGDLPSFLDAVVPVHASDSFKRSCTSFTSRVKSLGRILRMDS